MADIKFISGEGKPRLIAVHAAPRVVGDGGGTYTATQVFANNIGVNYGVRIGMRAASYKVLSPPGALTAGTPTSAGAVTPGTHSYKVTFVSPGAETGGGTTSNIITAVLTTGQTVPLSAIPLGPAGTTARKIYRTIAGNTGSHLLLATIADNTTTIYSDTLADASLGAAVPTAGQPNKWIWGKVTAVVSGSLTVDQWVGGTPTDGQTCYVDGWVIDLPFCDENHLLEQFTSDQLIHNLYRSRKEGKDFGWTYEAKLSYESLIEADVLLSLRPALNAKQDDRLILIPRVDRMTRGYNVLKAGAIKIARHVDRGHKFVVFAFQGKEDVPFPIPESGYGFGYAKRYGRQL